MSDMLKRFYEQLDIKIEEIRQAEARREVVRQKASEPIIDLINKDHEINRMWGEVDRIKRDIESLTGT